MLWSFKADAVIFNDRIGQKFLASFFREGACVLFGKTFERHFDEFADADIFDAGEAERSKCMLNGFALGVENAGLERDVNLGFQTITSC